MTRTDILEELNKLPADERLGIVESALRQLREQLLTGQVDVTAERRERLSIAADALKTAYETDAELTAFTLCLADSGGSRVVCAGCAG